MDTEGLQIALAISGNLSHGRTEKKGESPKRPRCFREDRVGKMIPGARVGRIRTSLVSIVGQGMFRLQGYQPMERRLSCEPMSTLTLKSVEDRGRKDFADWTLPHISAKIKLAATAHHPFLPRSQHNKSIPSFDPRQASHKINTPPPFDHPPSPQKATHTPNHTLYTPRPSYLESTSPSSPSRRRRRGDDRQPRQDRLA